MKQFLWTEIYRPETIDDCILPERLKDLFKSYAESGEVDNLLLTGTPGVGKTTIALALAKEVGASVMMLNSSDERGIDVVRGKIKSFAGTMSVTGTKKVLILDEADNLTPDAQDALRGIIEEFSKNCSFVFTCNRVRDISDAIKSRTTFVDFNLRNDEKSNLIADFYKRAVMILKRENVSFNKNAVLDVIVNLFPDFRRTLGELQRLSRAGAITPESVKALGDKKDIDLLLTALVAKKFNDVHKFVLENSDIPAEKMFDALFNRVSEYVKPEFVPMAIIILFDHAKYNSVVANQQLNLMSCLSTLMMECKFKNGE